MAQTAFDAFFAKLSFRELATIGNLDCFNPREPHFANYTCREYDRAAFTNDRNCLRCEAVDYLRNSGAAWDGQRWTLRNKTGPKKVVA